MNIFFLNLNNVTRIIIFGLTLSACREGGIGRADCSDEPICYKWQCEDGSTASGCSNWVEYCHEFSEDEICPVELPVIAKKDFAFDRYDYYELFCDDPERGICSDLASLRPETVVFSESGTKLVYPLTRQIEAVRGIKFCKGNSSDADLKFTFHNSAGQSETLSVNTSYPYARENRLNSDPHSRYVIDGNGHFPCTDQDAEKFDNLVSALVRY